MQVETSVHGQPVAGIVSLSQAGDEPTLLRSSTLLMQKVRCPLPLWDGHAVAASPTLGR